MAIPVTGVDIAKSILKLTMEKIVTAVLAYTVSPTTATNKNVTWTSDDPTIASVDQQGRVTANSEGKTRVRIVTEDGGFTDFCVILVVGRGNTLSPATMRTDDNLEAVDVAICRTDPDTYHPQYIKTIFIRDNEVRTATSYQVDKPPTKWVEDEEVLGYYCRDVASEYDGSWVRNFEKKWAFITEGEPWVFKVDIIGNLYAKVLYSSDDWILLASSVVKVRAVRSWKNTAFVGRDSGLFLPYLKEDGKLYYRNYAQQENSAMVWEDEREIATVGTPVVNFDAFRTNDYRTGIVYEVNNKIYWKLSVRNWVGMAIETDIVTARIVPSLEYTKITYVEGYKEEVVTLDTALSLGYLFALTDNTLVKLENTPTTRVNELGDEYQDWGFVIAVRLNYESINTPTFVLTSVETSSVIPVSSVAVVEEGYEYNLYIDDTQLEFGINTISGDINLSVSNFYNEAELAFTVISQDFTPTNLEVPSFNPPEVELIWNE